MSYVIPHLICLLLQVGVNGVQLNSVMEFLRCDPLSHPGEGDEPDRFVLHELLSSFLVVREGVQGDWWVGYY